MNIFKSCLLSVVLVLGISGQLVFSGIVNSAHDFSLETWSDNEICKPCHTPHNAVGTQLWNRSTSVGPWTQRPGNTLGSESLMCLSCHDGTIALDSFGGSTGTTFVPVAGLVDTDLTNDHPIGVAYPSTGDYKTKVVVDASSLVLFGDNVECASCHDVHNKDNNSKLLRIDNTGSALCLTCHEK